MATALKNLSTFKPEELEQAPEFKFGIVCAEWNTEVTGALLEGCMKTLKEAGVPDENIKTIYVPGSFELTSGAKLFAEAKKYDAVIALGCIIQGETRHFDFIAQAVANGLMSLNVDYMRPFIFGVLTTENMQQAIDRAGGKHGNKGVEAAVTAIKMAAIKENFEF